MAVQQQLDSCLQQFQRLLDRARKDDWQDIEQGIDQCQRQLAALETEDLTPEQAAPVRAQLQQIQQLHQQLMALTVARRDKAFTQLRKDNEGKKMKAAYGQVKRPT